MRVVIVDAVCNVQALSYRDKNPGLIHCPWLQSVGCKNPWLRQGSSLVHSAAGEKMELITAVTLWVTSGLVRELEVTHVENSPTSQVSVGCGNIMCRRGGYKKLHKFKYL